MNDRQMLLIAGPRLDDGMTLLTALWEANLDLAAEVIQLADLPRQLRYTHPHYLIITGWDQKQVVPLVHLLATHTATALTERTHLILLDQRQPYDAPPHWHCIPTNELPTLLQGLLISASVFRMASKDAGKDLGTEG